MEWLISLGLLVALMGRLELLRERLRRLRRTVDEAWARWLTAALRRNECLGEWERLLPEQPPDSELARLLADSQDYLGAPPPLPEGDAAPPIAEVALAQEAARVHGAPPARGAAEEQLRTFLGGALKSQRQSVYQLRGAVRVYNEALQPLPVRIAAPLLGFSTLTLPRWLETNHPSEVAPTGDERE